MHKIALPLISVLLLVIFFEVYFYTNLQNITRTITVSRQNNTPTPIPSPPDFGFCNSLKSYKVNEQHSLKVLQELTGSIKNLSFSHKTPSIDDSPRLAFFIVDTKGEKIEAYSFSDEYISQTVKFFQLEKNGEKVLVDKYALKEGEKIKFTLIQDIKNTTPYLENATQIEIDILQ